MKVKRFKIGLMPGRSCDRFDKPSHVFFFFKVWRQYDECVLMFQILFNIVEGMSVEVQYIDKGCRRWTDALSFWWMTGKVSVGTLFDIGLVLEKAELWVRRCPTKLCDRQCVTRICLSECRLRVTSQWCRTMERSKISQESQLVVCLHCLHMAGLQAVVNETCPTITTTKKNLDC